MFSEFAIDQHPLDLENPIYAKNYSDKKFTFLSFGRSSFHLSVWTSFTLNHASQIYAAKRVCSQFETLALITCCDASLQHQSSLFSFITKPIEFVFPSFRRLFTDECRTKSLEINFLLAIFKFCTTNHLFKLSYNYEIIVLIFCVSCAFLIVLFELIFSFFRNFSVYCAPVACGQGMQVIFCMTDEFLRIDLSEDDKEHR